MRACQNRQSRQPPPTLTKHSTPKVAGNSPLPISCFEIRSLKFRHFQHMIECFIIELHAKVEDAHRRFTDTQRRSSTPEGAKQPRPRPTGIGDEAGAGSAGKRGSAYSLTPPAVRPETMYFCRYWNSRITGMAAITEPAAKMPHGATFWSDAHMYMPTARVN